MVGETSIKSLKSLNGIVSETINTKVDTNTTKLARFWKMIEGVDFTSPQTEYVETVNKKVEANAAKLDRVLKLTQSGTRVLRMFSGSNIVSLAES